MPHGKATDSYHHGDLRNALLSAGERLLNQQGTAGLSLREVARIAGVSHAAPYRHFRNKAALLTALAQRGFERLRDAIQAAAGRVPHGPEQQLIAAGTAYVRRAIENPELTQLMFSGVVAPYRASQNGLAGDAAFKALQNIIETGITAGVFRQREPGELALVAWTSMHGMALLVSTGLVDVDPDDPVSVDSFVAAVASNVIYGIAR